MVGRAKNSAGLCLSTSLSLFAPVLSRAVGYPSRSRISLASFVLFPLCPLCLCRETGSAAASLWRGKFLYNIRERALDFTKVPDAYP